MKKTITIKNAFVSDKEAIDKLAEAEKITLAEAFHVIVEQGNVSTENGEAFKNMIAETEKLKAQIQQQKQVIETMTAESTENGAAFVEDLKKVIQDHILKITSLKLENESLQELLNDKTEIEKSLSGNQFICELDEQTAYNARKIRKFAVKDGFLDFETDKEYPNKLANLAIKAFINRHYIDLID